MAYRQTTVSREDVEEDCNTLLAVASMAIELKAFDKAIAIADHVVRAAPHIREAHIGAVLFRLIDGQISEAVEGAERVCSAYPEWHTASILKALVDQSAGGNQWQDMLNRVIMASEDDSEIEFARALLEA